MLFNPFLRALEFQAQSVAYMSEFMLSCASLRRTQVQCMQTLMTMPREQMAKIVMPSVMPLGFVRRSEMELFRGNAASMNVSTEHMQIEAAENEGMGTAILSAPRRYAQLKAVEYDAPCNMDAQAMEAHEAVTDKPQSIKKWFDKNAVADEQDIFDDRLPSRRVYSGIGQSPDAPSAIAVLERYKWAKKSVSA